jgi:prepilin-type N-terminal cleavage/methylation domain-containing protein
MWKQGKVENRGQAGFTLLEMMIVVTIIGILSAIVLPPISAYVHHAKVTQTALGIQRVGEAWTVYAATHGYLSRTNPPQDGDIVTPGCPYLLTLLQLEGILKMTVPATDGFGNAIEYRSDAYPPTMLMIRSPNADGGFQGSYTQGTFFDPADTASDIVWFDANKVQWPNP